MSREGERGGNEGIGSRAAGGTGGEKEGREYGESGNGAFAVECTDSRRDGYGDIRLRGLMSVGKKITAEPRGGARAQA